MGNYYKFGRRKLFITSAIEANAFSPQNKVVKINSPVAAKEVMLH